MKIDRLPSLDGLRAIAVGLVIVCHSGHLLAFARPELLDHLVSAGGIRGVDVFFALSGFLITHLLCVEFEKTGTVSLSGFYLRRSLRILPPVTGYLIVVAALTLLGVIAVEWRLWFSALFFYTDYVHFGNAQTSALWLSHMWSLSMEEQFYFIWPVVFVWLGPKRSLWVALGVACVMPLVRTGTYFLFPAQHHLFGRAFHLGVDKFLLGCALGIIWRDPRLARFLTTKYPNLVGAALAMLLLVVDPLLEFKFHGLYTLSVGITLRSMVAALLVVWAVTQSECAAGKLLNCRPARWLGLISYSVYLWQNCFTSGESGSVSLAIVGSIGLGAIWYWLFEKPFIRLRQRYRGSIS